MKRITMIELILTVVLLNTIISFSSCDSWSTDLKADIDTESKDYCLFGQGSYWIYQDSATLKTDKVVIYETEYEHSYQANYGISYLWETYFMRCNHFIEDTLCQVNLLLTSMLIDDKNVKNGIIKPIYLVATGNSIDKYGIITYSNYHNGIVGDFLCPFRGMGECLTYEMFYPTYQVNNKEFSNVKVFSYPIYTTQTTYQTKVYWAKHVGLIRVEAILEGNPVVRNLIQYNVQPYN
jgi:hypothetical protein